MSNGRICHRPEHKLDLEVFLFIRATFSIGHLDHQFIFPVVPFHFFGIKISLGDHRVGCRPSLLLGFKRHLLSIL